jgi:hypothetical protein
MDLSKRWLNPLLVTPFAMVCLLIKLSIAHQMSAMLSPPHQITANPHNRCKFAWHLSVNVELEYNTFNVFGQCDARRRLCSCKTSSLVVLFVSLGGRIYSTSACLERICFRAELDQQELVWLSTPSTPFRECYLAVKML